MFNCVLARALDSLSDSLILSKSSRSNRGTEPVCFPLGFVRSLIVPLTEGSARLDFILFLFSDTERIENPSIISKGLPPSEVVQIPITGGIGSTFEDAKTSFAILVPIFLLDVLGRASSSSVELLLSLSSNFWSSSSSSSSEAMASEEESSPSPLKK